MASSLLWGIDLGGTKLEGVVVDPLAPTKPRCRMRIDTEADRGYDHILSRFRQLIEQMATVVGERPRAIGIGTPGILDPKTSRLKNCNTQCLNTRPLRDDLESVLECPVVLANDANLFALAEYCFGAARGAHVCFGIIMGTGVGGGIIIDGKVHTGAHGIAGEWGHNVLISDGVPCPCGKRGCVERYLSGPALEQFYSSESGTHLSMSEIHRRAAEGTDPVAVRTMERLLSLFGQALSTVINILDPEVIVLGGGLSNIEELCSRGVTELRKHLFNDRFEARIVRNQLGDSAGVFGAAALAQTILSDS